MGSLDLIKQRMEQAKAQGVTVLEDKLNESKSETQVKETSIETQQAVQKMKKQVGDRGKQMVEFYIEDDKRKREILAKQKKNENKGRPVERLEPMKKATFSLPVRTWKALHDAVRTHSEELGTESMSKVIENLVEQKLTKMGIM
ncbi:MAG: hypothetical protein LBQ41_00780 [Candidatus Ancillula sp.]|jgi:hypothetical protein|nr:hypothetical protein [Candidatus Ancillula sp.]